MKVCKKSFLYQSQLTLHRKVRNVPSLTGEGKKVSSCVLAHRLPGCKPRAASASLPWQAGPQAAQGASELGWGQTVVVCSWGTLSQLPSAQVCVRGLTHLDVELSLQRQGAPESVCGTPWNLSPWFSIFCWSFLFAPHHFLPRVPPSPFARFRGPCARYDAFFMNNKRTFGKDKRKIPKSRENTYFHTFVPLYLCRFFFILIHQHIYTI